MVEPVSAVTIASAVVKVVMTTVTTAQTISDYVARYNIAEIQIVAMKTECSTILSALLQLQDIMIHNDILQRPAANLENRTLAYIQNDYRGILSQCFAVFSLLNERLQKLDVDQLNKRSRSSAKAKIRAVWFGDSMKILRENIKGQASAITILLAAFQNAASARIADSVTLNTESILNNTEMLEKIYQLLTKRENAYLLKRSAEDARSLSSLPLARRVIEQNEDSHSVFEGRANISGKSKYRESAQAKNRSSQAWGKQGAAEKVSLPGFENFQPVDVDSDRLSFVTARTKLIPSIKSIFRARNSPQSGDRLSGPTLDGASTIRPILPLHHSPDEPNINIRKNHVVSNIPNDGNIDEEAAEQSIDKLQDEQKTRWEYLLDLSPHQIFLDQTIDEYEETEKEFEERAKSLRAQISG